MERIFVLIGRKNVIYFVLIILFHENTINFCSDCRYESNGIFVLGVGFFSSDKVRLFN